VQHARLNGVCAAHQRTGLFSTAKCEAEIIKNDEALHEVWGKKGGCPHKACPPEYSGGIAGADIDDAVITGQKWSMRTATAHLEAWLARHWPPQISAAEKLALSEAVTLPVSGF
jgi:hypothetical protein